MNPAVGRHLGHEPEPEEKETHDGSGGTHPHSVSIHHAGPHPPHPSHPHHVHVHHADGTHEHSEHANFGEAMNHAQSVGGGGGQEPDGDEYSQADGTY